LSKYGLSKQLLRRLLERCENLIFMSEIMPILGVPVERIDGTPTSLAEHKGKVLLIVNVASQCGFTPQYAALETPYETNREKGFVVCGFPANDWRSQGRWPSSQKVTGEPVLV